jgi:hypothetical protein
MRPTTLRGSESGRTLEVMHVILSLAVAHPFPESASAVAKLRPRDGVQ